MRKLFSITKSGVSCSQGLLNENTASLDLAEKRCDQYLKLSTQLNQDIKHLEASRSALENTVNELDASLRYASAQIKTFLGSNAQNVDILNDIQSKMLVPKAIPKKEVQEVKASKPATGAESDAAAQQGSRPASKGAETKRPASTGTKPAGQVQRRSS